MQVRMITVGMFQSNCFIASCDETGEAIIIDAGDDGDSILKFVRDQKLRVTMIVNTHAHIDHVSALAEVASALSVPVVMHKNEMPIYENLAQHAMMFGLATPASVSIDRFVADGDVITFGRLSGHVIETPGHSPGGISLAFKDLTPPRIFVGDVLFHGSIGRTDLPGANHQQMVATLENVIMKLPEDMVVYAGHGPETTIGIEKLTNPFLVDLTP
ncbi:MAG: MBL fold metallo-hydrolase [Candidatus Krumholzibacteria bacterium]|nr:MBL fold metallo-hydrolase [Candidatus Krumholzibacteria bacterium]